MSHAGDDGDRPRRSWAEIDRQRGKGRSDQEPRPRGRYAEANARRATERYVKELDSLFGDAPAGAEGEALAQAVREAHGTDGLLAACRELREAAGYPRDAELVSIFLDSGDEELVVGTLDAVLAAAEADRFEATPSLRRQLAILAEDFNDAIASRAEDVVAAL